MADAYLLITIASVMFSIQFAFTKKYQLAAGTDMKAAFLYNALSPLAFCLIMFFLDGCKIEVTPFSLLMSMLWAVVANAITYFSIQALALGSVSNYSLFLLGGGMVLPAIYGAIWGGDTFGFFKITGIVLVLVAVCTQINFKEKTNKTALFYFMMLFLLYGFISIISSVYQSNLPFEKTSEIQFSILRSITTILVGGVAFGSCFAVEKYKRPDCNIPIKNYIQATPWAAISGLINGVANLLLLFSLTTLEPSLQYPIITGGSIFLSALIGLVFKEKPNTKTWISVAFAVVGTIVIIF